MGVLGTPEGELLHDVEEAGGGEPGGEEVPGQCGQTPALVLVTSREGREGRAGGWETEAGPREIPERSNCY